MVRFGKSAFGVATMLAALVASRAMAAPIPAQDFARLPVATSVSLSPDGRHVAAVTSPDGTNTFITIWRTDAPNEKPVVLGLGATSVKLAQQRFMGVSFIKDDRIAVNVRQVSDDNLAPRHLVRLLLNDVDGKGNWQTALGQKDQSAAYTPTIVSKLARDKDHILVLGSPELSDARGGSGEEAYIPDLYKVDVHRGQAELVARGSDKFSNYQVNAKGEVAAKQTVGFEQGHVYIAQLLRDPATGKFEEHFRWYAKDREPTEVVAFTDDPHVVLVRSAKGRDKAAIYEYDQRTRKLGEVAFETKLFDAEGVVLSTAAADYGQVIGFRYNADHTQTYWIDGRMASILEGARKTLGITSRKIDWTDPASGAHSQISVDEGATVELTGWSDDRSRVLIEKSGPRTPPEYYLYQEGQPLRLLVRSSPQLASADFGDTRLTQYKARDGLVIPAFLTTPPESFGSGPHPAIVLPHGGPWARDELGWDASGWTQYFASRGYVVIQPQFRGSQGWGQKLWRAGDGEWGQTMQDDNDDAAKWLIAERLADPKRIAIFGYSYGGYAAMAGAVRPNGLYQCAVAGAGVAELATFQGDTEENRFLQEFQRPTIKGLDPLAHAREISIPLLLIHGDRDRTVPISESKRMSAALGDKPHALIVSKDMGHQFVYWQPKDTELMLVETEKFFNGACKPGGL